MLTTGSPKQIAWALKIRMERLDSWRRADPEVFKHVVSSLDHQTSAAWWITHREKSLGEVLRYLQGDVPVKAAVKSIPKGTAASLPVSSSSKLSSHASNNDAVYRFEGETRSILTGDVVVDPACPF